MTMTISILQPTQRLREMLPTLQVIHGKELLRFITIPEGQEVVIGRGAEADLVLDDPSISRRHALVRHIGEGQITVHDLHSTNGTAVNGHPVTQTTLHAGDHVEVGSVGMRLDLSSPDELSHLGRVQEKLAAADTDPLTGLHNRRFLESDLPSMLDRLDKNGKPVSAIFIDLDRFKVINDEHGHAVGDEVLASVAKIALIEVRDHDFCVRYGGEEVLVVLPRTVENHAAEIAERIRKAISRHEWERTSEGLLVTASLGVAERRLGEDLCRWLGRADAAMYAAKGEGRNRVNLAGK
ncbi:MAG: GGDEF domain-containing protein [Deltaproteobacteria bacterium]|nr:GGDEF domain-containing protein [Deltaproteobacteria bacterium]